VEVDVEVDRPAEALDGGHASGPRIGHPRPPRGPSLPGEEGPREEVEEPGRDLRIPRREEPEPAREGEHPLPDGDLREDVVDEVVGGVLHPAGVAGRAAPGLAGEGDEPLEAAVRTADPREAAARMPQARYARRSRSTWAGRPRPVALRSRAAARKGSSRSRTTACSSVLSGSRRR
jgi:hypothetical protein